MFAVRTAPGFAAASRPIYVSMHLRHPATWRFSWPGRPADGVCSIGILVDAFMGLNYRGRVTARAMDLDQGELGLFVPCTGRPRGPPAWV